MSWLGDELKSVEKKASQVGESVSHGAHRLSEEAHHLLHAAGKVAHKVGHAVREAEHKVGHVVHEAEHKVGHAVQEAEHKVGHAVQGAEHKVGHVVHEAEHKIGHTTHEAERMLSNFHVGDKVSSTFHAAERVAHNVEHAVVSNPTVKGAEHVVAAAVHEGVRDILDPQHAAKSMLHGFAIVGHEAGTIVHGAEKAGATLVHGAERVVAHEAGAALKVGENVANKAEHAVKDEAAAIKNNPLQEAERLGELVSPISTRIAEVGLHSALNELKEREPGTYQLINNGLDVGKTFAQGVEQATKEQGEKAFNATEHAYTWAKEHPRQALEIAGAVAVVGTGAVALEVCTGGAATPGVIAGLGAITEVVGEGVEAVGAIQIASNVGKEAWSLHKDGAVGVLLHQDEYKGAEADKVQEARKNLKEDTGKETLGIAEGLVTARAGELLEGVGAAEKATGETEEVAAAAGDVHGVTAAASDAKGAAAVASDAKGAAAVASDAKGAAAVASDAKGAAAVASDAKGVTAVAGDAKGAVAVEEGGAKGVEATGKEATKASEKLKDLMHEAKKAVNEAAGTMKKENMQGAVQDFRGKEFKEAVGSIKEATMVAAKTTMKSKEAVDKSSELKENVSSDIELASDVVKTTLAPGTTPA